MASGPLVTAAPEDDARLAATTMRAISRRLLWFLLALYFLAVLDRGAMSFAALRMNADLGLTAQMFGIGVGIMFGAYALFEVPSNLLLARFGARFTLTRIAMLWGLATMLHAATRGPWSLYLVRGFLGFAESGLYPGIMLIFSLWVPFAYRARYNAVLNYAAPASYIAASLISGAILGLDGALGLPGWKWLFLLEGAPAIVLGVVGLFVLTDRPAETRWLSPAQKRWLTREIDADVGATAKIGEASVWKTARQPVVIACGLVNFALFGGLGTLLPWLPQIAKGLGVATSRIGVVTAIPSVAALIGMALLSRRSDRRGERFLHTAAMLLLGSAGLAIVAFAADPIVMTAGYCVAFIGCFAAQSIFWTIPQSHLSRESAPGAIGVIGMIGSFGGLTVPIVVGSVRDWSGGFRDGLLLSAALLVVGAGLVVLVRARLLRGGA